MPEETGPQTLLEAVRHFSDLGVCHNYMIGVKWPNGIACPKCSGTEIGRITTRRMLKCRGCGKQFGVKVGTIFEDSPLGLDKWFVAVWCIANAKNGISSCELARALGVRQPSAWFMFHRIRAAMETGSFRNAKRRAKVITGRGALRKLLGKLVKVPKKEVELPQPRDPAKLPRVAAILWRGLASRGIHCRADAAAAGLDDTAVRSVTRSESPGVMTLAPILRVIRPRDADGGWGWFGRQLQEGA